MRAPSGVLAKRPACPWLVPAAMVLCGCAVEAETGWQAELGRRIAESAALRGNASDLAESVHDGDVATGDTAVLGVTLIDGEWTKEWHVEVSASSVDLQRVVVWRTVQDFETRVVPSEARQREKALANARPVPDWSDLAFATPVARIRVEAFHDSGESLGTAASDAVVSQLRDGLLPACRAGHRQRDVMRDRVGAGRTAPILQLDDDAYDDVAAVGAGVAVCERLFRILRENAVMQQILWEVLALPSLWSIVTNWGVRVTFSVDFFAAERVDAPLFAGEPRELWSVPMMVLLNGQPGLLARVIVGPSGSPEGVVAGVHGIVAQHPTDPDRRVHVRLLSSRRAADAGGRVPGAEPPLAPR